MSLTVVHEGRGSIDWRSRRSSSTIETRATSPDAGGVDLDIVTGTIETYSEHGRLYRRATGRVNKAAAGGAGWRWSKSTLLADLVTQAQDTILGALRNRPRIERIGAKRTVRGHDCLDVTFRVPLFSGEILKRLRRASDGKAHVPTTSPLAMCPDAAGTVYRGESRIGTESGAGRPTSGGPVIRTTEVQEFFNWDASKGP